MTPEGIEDRNKDLKSKLRQEPNIVLGHFWVKLSLEPHNLKSAGVWR
jgi:hypothetical protein